MSRRSICWCGSHDLLFFSEEYLLCDRCKTLVIKEWPDETNFAVGDDDQGFYSKTYWFEHQENDLQFENILTRARSDIPGRVMHWLSALLKYKLPPGNTLELGCSHGSFVSVLQWSGFQASGLELSPWVVDFARQTFQIPMYQGRLEDQEIEAGSLDAVILMDVLEHLPDPVSTISAAAALLKNDGVLIIQTPCYPDGRAFESLQKDNDPFLMMFQPPEHVYLFSQASVRQLLNVCNLPYVEFEPAFFDMYDMFLVASRHPLQRNTQEQIDQALLKTPSGRLVLALLDKEAESKNLNARWQEAEADREARLQVITEQGQQYSELQAQYSELQAQYSELQAQYSGLQAQYSELQNKYLNAIQLLKSISQTPTYRLVRRLGRWRWVEENLALLEPSTLSVSGGGDFSPNPLLVPSPASTKGYDNGISLEKLLAENDADVASRPNRELIANIRSFNHQMVDHLSKIHPLENTFMLDIGASPDGFALERSLKLNVAFYAGVGLDVKNTRHILGPHGHVGMLIQMDAMELFFPDDMFDVILSISTFEHISNPAKALDQMARVLKRGGHILLNFEPIWTASYGHHLHHFGEVSRLVPPWAHLMWSEEEMREALQNIWPTNSPITLERAVEWTYRGEEINRYTIRQYKELFKSTSLKVEWMQEMKDPQLDQRALENASERSGFGVEELAVKGFSVLLTKE